MTIARDERGRLLPGSQLGQGRPKLEVEERLRSAIYAVCDQDTMTKWVAAVQKKLAHGDQWATTFVFERNLGKVPDRLESAGYVKVLVEYVSADNARLDDSAAPALLAVPAATTQEPEPMTIEVESVAVPVED